MKLSKVLLKFAVLSVALGSVGITSRAVSASDDFAIVGSLVFDYDDVRVCSLTNRPDVAKSKLIDIVKCGENFESKLDFFNFKNTLIALDKLLVEKNTTYKIDDDFIEVEKYYLSSIRPMMICQIIESYYYKEYEDDCESVCEYEYEDEDEE